MGPDELRELAHRLETGLDVVDLVERMDKGEITHKQMEALVVERVEAAVLPASHVICVAAAMANVGLRLKKEQQAVVDALSGEDDVFPADHEAEVVAFRPRDPFITESR